MPQPPIPTSPQGPRGTNRGIPLYSQFRGGESDTVREIPPEWRAALDLLIIECPVPIDTAVVDLTSGVLAIKREQKFSSEATSRETYTDTELPATLLEYDTDRNKEIVTRTRNFRFIDDLGSIAVPAALRDVKTKNFGNKHFEETIEDTGEFFIGADFTEEQDNPIPARFRPQISTSSYAEREIGIAVDPTLGAGDLMKREKQENVFIKNFEHRFQDLSILPLMLDSFRLTPEQQIETIVETLDTTYAAPSISALSTKFDVDELEPGLFTEVVGTVPSVFSKQLYQRERQLLWQLPPEFRAALEEITTSDEQAGTAADPGALSGDEVLKSEQQVTVFKKKVESKTRDLSVLPLTFTDYRVTPEGQVETIIKTLDDSDPGAPTPDGLTLESLVQNQGAGLFLTTLGTVDSVFSKQMYAEERQLFSALPAEFRSLITESIQSLEELGTATDPTLGAGESYRSEQQVTEFRKKVEVRGLDLSGLPIVLNGQELTEEFGGGVLNVVFTLDTTPLTIDEGEFVTSSRTKELGGGLYSKETKQQDLMAWPTLDGQSFDKEMQVNVLTEEQTVAAAFTPATPSVGDYWVESKKPIDYVRSKRIKLTKTPTATDVGSAIIEEVDGPFQFPGLVYAVSGGYYRRQASAQLCQHILRTWWLSSATKPTRGLPGSGMDVEVQDIIMDDIIISTLNDVTRLEYSGMCLHDAITTFGTFVYAATVPSVTAYIALIGTEIVVAASIEVTDIPNLWKIQTKSVIAR